MLFALGPFFCLGTLFFDGSFLAQHGAILALTYRADSHDLVTSWWGTE